MNIPNFPTISEYEYTDEDFIRNTQLFWVGVEAELQESKDQKINKIDNYYTIDENEVHDESFCDYEYNYDDNTMSPDEADWYFDNLDENRTPDGWYPDGWFSES